jgi:hypothetical protein
VYMRWCVKVDGSDLATNRGERTEIEFITISWKIASTTSPVCYKPIYLTLLLKSVFIIDTATIYNHDIKTQLCN